MQQIYLDNAATTPVRPEVEEVMQPYFCEKYGNPSGIYKMASECRQALETVRKQIGKTLKVSAEEIYFTSGGTESDNQAIITCEKAKFNIAAQSGDDFSYLPAIEREDFITISEFTLKEVVRQTIFSIADNDTNKMMTGELFEIDNDVLRVVSLDGHRISIRKIELKDAYQPRKVIVPGKTLQEISKIIGGEADAEVEISFTKNHIVFEFDRTLVVSRLIEGEYFRIDQMLSSDYETRVHVNKKELLDCIDRATLLIKEGDKKPIIIDIKNESMELKIKSQIGSMDELIFCTKDGKDLMIGFNPKFLVDALRVIDEEEVTIYLMNSIAPCIIRDETSSYLYLILPINVSNSNV